MLFGARGRAHAGIRQLFGGGGHALGCLVPGVAVVAVAHDVAPQPCDVVGKGKATEPTIRAVAGAAFCKAFPKPLSSLSPSVPELPYVGEPS